MNPPRPAGRVERLRGAVDVLWREIGKFGVIGAFGFLIDAGGFNLLYYTVLHDRLTTAKLLSGAAATAFAWVGNRSWTFRERRNRPAHHELLLFFAVNGVALAVSAGYLAFTHYALGMDSRLAINVNNVIGIGIGTLFRFWTYRKFVFAGEHPGDPGADVVGRTSLR